MSWQVRKGGNTKQIYRVIPQGAGRKGLLVLVTGGLVVFISLVVFVFFFYLSTEK